MTTVTPLTPVTHVTPVKGSTTSSTYSDYSSDYDINLNVDDACKGKLVNIEDEPEQIFMMKNNFYMNYGIEKYTTAIDAYNAKIKHINFNSFNEHIWARCFELCAAQPNVKKRPYCFAFINIFQKDASDTSVPIDVESLKNTFMFLHKMHVKDTKIKIWQECIEDAKKNI